MDKLAFPDIVALAPKFVKYAREGMSRAAHGKRGWQK
jgi:hypothetical protein